MKTIEQLLAAEAFEVVAEHPAVLAPRDIGLAQCNRLTGRRERFGTGEHLGDRVVERPLLEPATDRHPVVRVRAIDGIAEHRDEPAAGKRIGQPFRASGDAHVLRRHRAELPIDRKGLREVRA